MTKEAMTTQATAAPVSAGRAGAPKPDFAKMATALVHDWSEDQLNVPASGAALHDLELRIIAEVREQVAEAWETAAEVIRITADDRGVYRERESEILRSHAKLIREAK